MNDDIKDMSLEGTDKEKAKIEKEGKEAITDMSLDEPQIPSAKELSTRLAKVLPDAGLIDTGLLKIVKMMDGSYKVGGIAIADLKAKDLAEIYRHLKSEEKK